MNNNHEFGIGFAINVNNKLSSIRINGTTEKEESIKDEFYDQLEQTIDLVPKQDMFKI